MGVDGNIGSSRWTNERCFGYKPTKLDFYPENISRLCVLRNNGPRLRKFTQVVVAPQTIKFLATWLQIPSSYFPLGQKVTGACLNTFWLSCSDVTNIQLVSRQALDLKVWTYWSSRIFVLSGRQSKESLDNFPASNLWAVFGSLLFLRNSPRHCLVVVFGGGKFGKSLVIRQTKTIQICSYLAIITFRLIHSFARLTLGLTLGKSKFDLISLT